MPGVARATSCKVVKSKSSICWREMTLTVCGVWRCDRFKPVAVDRLRAVYKPVPSVARSASALTTTAGMLAKPPSARLLRILRSW
ncbi:hypothetical protein D3C81_1504300 [compost metagenome]